MGIAIAVGIGIAVLLVIATTLQDILQELRKQHSNKTTNPFVHGAHVNKPNRFGR